MDEVAWNRDPRYQILRDRHLIERKNIAHSRFLNEPK